MKKIFFALVITLILGLSASYVYGQTMVQSGNFSVNYETPGYTLDKNEGTRSFSVEVTFLKPFETKPDVIVAVNHVDVDKNTALRYKVETSSISRDGFTLKIMTWGDCKIFGMSGNWLAHSE
ncbi:MAG: hypothetical protein Kow0098_02760 [Ignavibacteriaceae bacterium]